MAVLTANYYPGSATRAPVLDLVQIIDGHRSPVMSFNVKNKREGRAVAKTYNARPWNF